MTYIQADGSIKIAENSRIMVMDNNYRIMFYSYNGFTVRRSLQNIFIKNYIINRRRMVERLGINEAKKIVNEFYSYARNYTYIPEHVNYEFLQDDAEKLIKIYGNFIPIVPPDQYLSIYLKITSGCPWNKCTFCDLYQNDKYNVLHLKDIESEINALKEYFGSSITSRRSIFLGDANAINIGSDRLFEYLDLIHSNFNLGIYSFMDVFTTLKTKKFEDFVRMRELGMKRVYVGLESGDPDVLNILNKKIDINESINFINTVKDAGINIGIIILIGAGGKKHSQGHINNTVNYLKKINFTHGDMIYLSELSENERFLSALKDKPMTPQEKYDEMFKFKSLSSFGVPVVDYNLTEAVY
ncbi:radical SAM protein [Acidiplasma aeolicum]|uniref:Radical SAM core domain-containing protein n=1 Tax=Acidiplasma aeolicum TaxID=507754 RepID=A0A0Q0WIX5_9ARCH|nr:radical SAM protein [Acidiplasma aeolicum]KQB35586.1 hypothetical protein AOG54_00480 [Acidiplasma aeolicum]